MKIVYLICILYMSTQILNAKESKKGILVWFYSLETKKNKYSGKVTYFKQTAGVNTSSQEIHNILPLSPQSKITKGNDNNWYLNLASQKLLVKKDRPFFLGQVLDLTSLDTYTKKLNEKDNVPVISLSFNASYSPYLLDRKDLQINDPLIIKKRDELLKKSPKLYDYLIAVDKFVLDHLDYKKPKRPNTAVDLLLGSRGWCGEHSKLKLALLRSAGIPTRGVYASKTGENGPAVNAKETSGVHSWLQVYISHDIGWITMPSTRKLNDNYNFVRHRGGYYIRALHLYQYPKNIQQKKYTNSLKRNGGVRGNGMFFDIDSKYFTQIQSITSEALDYSSIPSSMIFNRIKNLPKQVQPLLYWFLISSPSKSIYKPASKLFLESLQLMSKQKIDRYYIISPTLVKERIDMQY